MNAMMNKICKAIFAMCLLIAGTASAALISGGDLTYDSTTGISWLDLTETAGQSYNAVMSGYGGFTTNLGFRFATGDELAQLRTDAGITGVRSISWDTSNIDNTRTLINLLGILSTDGHSYGDNGYIADSNQLGQGIHAVATFAVNDIGEYDAYIPGYDPPNSFFSYSTDPSWQANNQWAIGSFLVVGPASPPTVPIPAAIWLVGSALAGFVGFARPKST